MIIGGGKNDATKGKIFSYTDRHLSVFFLEKSVLVLSPYFNQVIIIIFFAIELSELRILLSDSLSGV